MKLNLLIITNDVPRRVIEDDLELLKEYIESRTPLDISYTFQVTAFEDLKHKSFGTFDTPTGRQELYGLDGIKEKLRPLTPRFVNHACIFLYRRNRSDRMVAHWTTWGELHPGTEFCEIAFTDLWDRTGDVFRVLSHEIFHILHQRAQRAGTWTVDTMDQYDHEFDPYSPNGNRARNLAELAPHWEIIAEQPLLKLYVKALARRLQANENHMPQPLLKPVTAAVSQAFGEKNPAYKSGIHNGTDYLTPIKTEVLGPTLCAITRVWKDHPTMGNACLVQFSYNGQPYTMRLLHLHKAPVLGTYKRGEVLCYTGNTGKSTGPHLHLELWKGKYRPELLYTEQSVRANLLDPEKFFTSSH